MEGIELIEAAGTYYGLGVDVLTLYITITSGYLIVAYLIGDKLTKTQVAIVNTLYIVMSSIAAYGTTIWIVRGVYFSLQQSAIEVGMPLHATYIVPAMIGVFMIGGIVTCLKFMWDVRHPKAE
jgi:hypothetical protein